MNNNNLEDQTLTTEESLALTLLALQLTKNEDFRKLNQMSVPEQKELLKNLIDPERHKYLPEWIKKYNIIFDD